MTGMTRRTGRRELGEPEPSDIGSQGNCWEVHDWATLRRCGPPPPSCQHSALTKLARYEADRGDLARDHAALNLELHNPGLVRRSRP